MACSRRQLLQGLGIAVATGCADGEDDDAAIATTPTEPAASASPWATGGTRSMSGTYRDPFASGLGATCTLLCSATLGPCYAATIVRKDISEGQLGLPVRMSFITVDAACNPIANAEIDIWHASPIGVYSGSDASPLCTLNDPAAMAARFCRGKQTTDANGRAEFDTVFPGWYRGRTVHVHFTVRVNGLELVTSQLVFDDALVDDITATQPIYSDRGARDTTNQSDNVVSAANASAYSFQTERQADGAMLAWKALVLRSPAETSCSLGGGPEGPGGSP